MVTKDVTPCLANTTRSNCELTTLMMMWGRSRPWENCAPMPTLSGNFTYCPHHTFPPSQIPYIKTHWCVWSFLLMLNNCWCCNLEGWYFFFRRNDYVLKHLYKLQILFTTSILDRIKRLHPCLMCFSTVVVESFVLFYYL